MKIAFIVLLFVVMLFLSACDSALPEKIVFENNSYHATEVVISNSSGLEYSGYNVFLYKIYSKKGIAVLPSEIAVRKSGIYYSFQIDENDKKSCAADYDCACGKDSGGNCAFGNIKFINQGEQCPDYCTGIAGNFEIRCSENICIHQNINNICASEGESLGAVIPGNTLECCPGLEPFIPEGIVGTKGICQKPGYKGDSFAGTCACGKVCNMSKCPCMNSNSSCQNAEAGCAKCMADGLVCGGGNCSCNGTQCGAINEKFCLSDNDCTPKECCHPKECINTASKTACNVFCTDECAPGTLDCGAGKCSCINGKCTAVIGMAQKQ